MHRYPLSSIYGPCFWSMGLTSSGVTDSYTGDALLPNPSPLPTLLRLHRQLSLRTLVSQHVQYALHLPTRVVPGNLHTRPPCLHPARHPRIIFLRPTQPRLQPPNLFSMDAPSHFPSHDILFPPLRPLVNAGDE